MHLSCFQASWAPTWHKRLNTFPMSFWKSIKSGNEIWFRWVILKVLPTTKDTLHVIVIHPEASSSWGGTIRGRDVCWLGSLAWRDLVAGSPNLTPKMMGIPIQKAQANSDWWIIFIFCSDLYTPFVSFCFQLHVISEIFTRRRERVKWFSWGSSKTLL